MSATTSSNLPESFTDVLIVGAGPAGLMAGQALARLGVKVRVIEKRLKGTQYGNADGVIPRTLEVFQNYGMMDELMTRSTQLFGAMMYKSGEHGIERQTPEINYPVASRFPFEVTSSIEHIEGTLTHAMEKYGVQVEQPLIPTSMSISDSTDVTHPVKIAISQVDTVALGDALVCAAVNGKTNGSRSSSMDILSSKLENLSPSSISVGTEIINAKYVIGADGARSWIRRSIGIQMEGEQSEHTWGVLDAAVVTDFPDIRMKTILETSVGNIIWIPREDGLSRIYMQLAPSDLPKLPDGRLDRTKAGEEEAKHLIISRIVKAMAPYSMEIKEVTWFTVFVVAQRIASKFSAGNRVFIAGDACHTHSPKAGQGANASMNDTHNLAWKLAHVIKGWAKPTLLDTYEAERRPFADELLNFDKKLSQIVDLGIGSTYIDLWRETCAYFGGLRVHYRSALTNNQGQNLAPGLIIGMRLPPSPMMRLADWKGMDVQDLIQFDGRYHVIIFAGNIQIANNAEQLIQFLEGLLSQENHCQDINAMIATHTVLSGRRDQLLWTEVPEKLRTWTSVFVDSIIQPVIKDGTVYETFGLGSSGAAILVRPDGYVSTIVEVSKDGGIGIVEFLEAL